MAAEGELEVTRARLARLEDLKRSKDELVSYYASLVPSRLQGLIPEDAVRCTRCRPCAFRPTPTTAHCRVGL